LLKDAEIALNVFIELRPTDQQSWTAAAFATDGSGSGQQRTVIKAI
jgi:hypothetical protein